MRRLANLRLLWWAMLFVPLALARPKTDTVTLVNGNDITCEIRSLRRDVLTAKTDSLSTVAIRWQDVTRVRSEVPFEIILTDGSTRSRPSTTFSSGAWTVGAAKVVRTPKRPSNTDRKSTRLNSSHLVISYAVFCLKKK